MKLSLIVPCYNEAGNIVPLLNDFQKTLKRNDVEVILVDNGSTDNTEVIFSRELTTYSFLRIVKVAKNQGYGFGILSGLKEAGGEYIGWTHGDMQTPLSDALKALEIIETRGESQKIYVKGRRNGRPLFDRFFTFGMSIFESLYLGKILYDINAQPNIFHKSFFKSWYNPPYDFSLDLYALYLAKKLGIPTIRFPVEFHKRLHGESHWNTNPLSKWRFIKRTLGFSVNLKKKLRQFSYES